MRFADTIILLYAAIIEASRVLGCRAVLSEDLGSGRDYDGIELENPFESQ